jgi:hypothetical protein
MHVNNAKTTFAPSRLPAVISRRAVHRHAAQPKSNRGTGAGSRGEESLDLAADREDDSARSPSTLSPAAPEGESPLRPSSARPRRAAARS